MKRFNSVLIMHCHTSGINYDDHMAAPFKDRQMITLGLIVMDLDSAKSLGELELKFRYDSSNVWDQKAHDFHKISREELNGGDSYEEGAEKVALFLDKHFDLLDGQIPIMGYGVGNFHFAFFKDMLTKEGYTLEYSPKIIDIYPMGLILGLFTSSDIIHLFGLESNKFNSLAICKAYMKIWKTFKHCVVGS